MCSQYVSGNALGRTDSAGELEEFYVQGDSFPVTRKKVRFLGEFEAYAPILNRRQFEEIAEIYLSEHITALEELVNYGTNLIPRCFTSSVRDRRPVIVVGVLLKQVVMMLDGAVELLRRSCVNTSYLQLRGAFEASVYIDWILQLRSDKRARAYYVWNVRRDLNWTKRARRGTAEHRLFSRETRRIWGIHIKEPAGSSIEQEHAEAEIRRIESFLNQRQYRTWNLRFDASRDTKTLRDRDWYSVLFPPGKRGSFFQICKAVRRISEYRGIYEIGSETMHGSLTKAHVEVGEGRLTFLPLRDPRAAGEIIQYLASVAFHTFNRVLEEYRPGESERFARKWTDEWSPTFRKLVYMEPKKETQVIV
jgi:hypothetical protein